MIGKRVPFLVLAILLAILIGCVRPIASVQGAAQSDDVVVTPAHWREGLRLRVGNTVRVPAPLRRHRWTVVTPRRVVRLLTALNRVQQPGPDGWRFEALAPGSASVTFTGFPVGGSRDDNQPNPPKFVLQVTVQ